MQPNYVDCNSTVYDMSYSPDGTKLACGLKDGTVRIYNTETRQEVWRKENQYSVKAVCFSPDGNSLAYGGGDKFVYVYNLGTGDVTNAHEHTDWVRTVQYSSSGDKLLSSSWDGTVSVWDVPNNTLLWSNQYHHGEVFACFSADETLVYVTGMNNDMSTSDATTGEFKDVVARKSSFVVCHPTNMAFVHHYRITFNDNTTIAPASSERVTSAVFSTDGTKLATGGWDGTVSVWDLETRTLVNQYTFPTRTWGHLTHSPWVRCMTLSPDGRSLAIGTGMRGIDMDDVSGDGEIAVWENVF
jgi:WD40 repeat protein